MKRVVIYLNNFTFEPDYVTKLTGVIHKWLGENNVHDNMSLYNFSHIHNNRFNFTSFDEKLQEKLMHGINNFPKMFAETKAIGFNQYNYDSDRVVFKTASPIFVKNNDNTHLLFEEAEQRAKEILLKRAMFAGVKLSDFEIKFPNRIKEKLIKIHNIKNKCFTSHVEIKGDASVKDFAAKVGIGNSTGCGFGFIY